MKKITNKIIINSLLIIVAIAFIKCASTENITTDKVVIPNPTYTDINNTYGFGVLNKIKGIWNGPVTSNTPLGNFAEWIVDFRPISENQISSKNELNNMNDIHMSFFIAKYNNEYRVCFRNGGSFAGQQRISYFLTDSVSETVSKSFYRFTEIVKGKKRAFTEVVFENNSLTIKSFTNKYNTQSTATPHMTWIAQLQDNTSCQPATNNFEFPKKTLTKDFSSTFLLQTEAIYYSIGGLDPYNESSQPYLGKVNVNYVYPSGFNPNSSKKVILIITTQPLISGLIFNLTNLKFRSRYVILDANNQNFTFNYMHPGTYYLYAIYDEDGNNNLNSGDRVSNTNTTFTLTNLGNVNSTAQINFIIP